MRKLLYQEILAQRKTLEEIRSSPRHPISLVLHNIRSAYNVGSIFRTADSALVEKIHLCGYTPYPPSAEIAKTSLGAIDTVPWMYSKSTSEAIQIERKAGKKIIAVELTDNSKPYDQIPIDDFPLCLILGNEISGIDDEILAMCDYAVDIPMFGIKHSLNVSVAAGIVIYQALQIFLKNQTQR